MSESKLYISHDSALHYWRTNPPRYVLEGSDRNIRVLRDCPTTDKQVRWFRLSEAEFGQPPVDVLVPPQGPRPRSILRYHVQKAQVPRQSLFPLRDGIHVVSPELCFVQLCKTLSFVEALELGMEFCGTYALRPDALEDKSSRDYQLTSVSSLRRKTNAWKDIHGLAQARRVVNHLVDASASPMETKVYLLLCLPQQYGGFNIEKPELNVEFDLPEEGRLILRQNKVKPDFLWRNRNLVIEYDGEYHSDPDQALRDEKRRVILETMGFTVLAVKKRQVYDPIAFTGVAEMIAKKCGKRLRPLTLKQRYARDNLRNALLTPVSARLSAATARCSIDLLRS